MDTSYKIVYSRRRTISIIINPDRGVVVKAPYRTPAREIDRFVNEKSDWINKTLIKIKTLVRIDNRKGYSDGDSILMFGKEHKLKLISSKDHFVRVADDSLIEAGFVEDNNPLKIKAMLEAWFMYVARKRFTGQFAEILEKYRDYGFHPEGFAVRKMKSRWGSCSSGGMIAVSYDLIRLGVKYSEYVMIHELCHLRQHNHGAAYYKLLSEVYPDWKKVREELKKYIR